MAVAIPLRSGARSQSEGALTAALYRQHAGELLRFAWHRLGRLEDAEDAVQATFLSAHRVLAEGERVREPRAWLFRILRNECLTRLAMTKRRGVHEELGEWHADSRASVAEQMESNDEFDVAVALLATLPEQQREAMVLREWLGMSAIETADVLDVTPQGVDALVYRARKALIGLDGVEAESACGHVRQALADAKIDSRVRAHLLACRSCRASARRLHAPEEMAAANGFLPLDSIASRLGESIPGFAVAGGAVAAAGGGVAAAGVASSLLAGTAAKVVVTVAVGAVVATGAVREAPALREALTPASNVQALPTAPPAKQPASADGTKRIVAPKQQTNAATAAVVAASDPAPQPGQAPAVVAVAAPAPVEAAPQGAPAPAEAIAGEDAPAAAPSEPAPIATTPPAVKTPAAPAAPATPVGSKAPTTPTTPVPAPATGSAPKPTTPAAPRSDDGKKAAEAAAEQAKRAAEQAKKAAAAAAEQAKKVAEDAKKAAEAIAEQAKKAAEQAKKATEAAKTPAKSAAPVTVAPDKSTPKGEQPKQSKPVEQPKQSKPVEQPKVEQPKATPPVTTVPAPAAAPAQVVSTPQPAAAPQPAATPAKQQSSGKSKQDRDKGKDD